MNEYIPFQSYPTQQQAEEEARILLAKGIGNIVANEVNNLDSNFVGARFSNPYWIKMKGADFERARNILLNEVTVRLEDVESDYLLLSFTDKELLEVMAKPEEWGAYNYQVARQLLEKKGIHKDEAIRQIKEEHLAALVKEKKGDTTLILVCYVLMSQMYLIPILAYFGLIRYPNFMLLPSLFSLLMGWIYAYSKKTLPNGQQVFSYTKSTRLKGKLLFYFTMAGAIFILLYFKWQIRPINNPYNFYTR